ncbi:hypothetical protein [Pseudoduganella violaceinigra]|uniref:hypothetical protein n=1 Tax=Pseudoduganella violaceinigra TaxID=246602 RepID=UPI0012B5BD79|nr:hypothetical protein [Pseudoduganella violaceinigra]
MAYELHITKAAEWSRSSQNPITEAEWTAAVAADGQMRMDAVATAENPLTHETIEVRNPFMASWIDPNSNSKHYFYYSRGKVTVKNPSEDVINKMKALAAMLGARVVGDEGESY